MHIIFADVDGTVYPESHTIHPQLFKDIAFAQQKNVEIVFCTGNGFFDNIKNLANKFDITYVVAANGASIFNAKTNKLLFSSSLNSKMCNDFLTFANQNGIMVSWWDQDSVYHNKLCTSKLVEKIKHYTTKEGNIFLKNQVAKDPFKIEFFGSIEQIDLMCDFLKKYDVEVIKMRPCHLEITNNKMSKGFGVDWICNLLKVDLQDTVSIGDSPNDIPMFKKTSLSYALDNAREELKKVATNFAASVEQNGLGEAIIDYMYRKKIDK